jgi:hypothetical protein
MGPGASFQPILASTLDGREWAPTAAAAPAKKKQGKSKGKNGNGGAGQVAPPTPKAVVFCSGKVYYDVIKAQT